MSGYRRYLNLFLTLIALFIAVTTVLADDPDITSVTVSPQVFTPTGCNQLTITATGAPGQTGIYALIDYEVEISLDEPPVNSGVYVGYWDGKESYNNRLYRSNPFTLVTVFGIDNIQLTYSTFSIYDISNVYVSSENFEPYLGEELTFSVNTFPELSATNPELALEIYGPKSTAIPLTLITDNTYTCKWDGRDGSGNLSPPGCYSAFVINSACGKPIEYEAGVSFTIGLGVTSVDVSPKDFPLNGTDMLNITVNATPNQTDLKAELGDYSFCEIGLLETSSGSGVYKGQWDGSIFGLPTPTAKYVPVRIYSPDYDFTSALTGSFNMYGITDAEATPISFEPGFGETTTITAHSSPDFLLTGLNLKAQIDGQLVLPMQEGPSGTYACTWDGKGLSGGFHSVRFFVNTPQSILEYPATALVTTGFGIKSVKVDPNPIIPTGCNSLTITAVAIPGLPGIPAYCDYDFLTNLIETSPGSGIYSGVYHINENMYPGVHTLRVGVNSPSVSTTFTILTLDSISYTNSYFDPANHDTVTINAFSQSGAILAGLKIEAHIVSYHSGSSIRTIPMVENQPGNYTCVWDLKDNNGNFASADLYYVEIYNVDCGVPFRYASRGNIAVVPGVTSISADPDPFIADGCNSTTITVHATPNQEVLTCDIVADTGSYIANCYLYESSPDSGIYIGNWNGSAYNYIYKNSDTVTLRVYHRDRYYSNLEKKIGISNAINHINIEPSHFLPSKGQTVKITATTDPASPRTGMKLKAQITGNPNRDIPMIESLPGTYTCEWDGKDSAGNIVAASSYPIQIANTACTSGLLNNSASVIVDIDVKSITLNPDPFVASGCNKVDITVVTQPGLQSLSCTLVATNLNSSIPLKESPALSGTYVGEFSTGSSKYLWIDDNASVTVSNAGVDVSTKTFKFVGVTQIDVSKPRILRSHPDELTITAETNDAENVMNSNLAVRLFHWNDYSRKNAVLTVPMIKNSLGNYICKFDGHDNGGILLPADDYIAVVFNMDCPTPARYAAENHFGLLDDPISIGAAKKMPEGSCVWLQGKVVTGIFQFSGFDYYVFVEEPDRKAALCIHPDCACKVNVNDVINFTGTVHNSDYDIFAHTVEKIGSSYMRPLAVKNRDLVHSNNEGTPQDWSGLDTSNMLVTTWGRIVDFGRAGPIISDGYLPWNDYEQKFGITVDYHINKFAVGDYIMATGIYYANGGFMGFQGIKPRSPNDVVKLKGIPQ